MFASPPEDDSDDLTDLEIVESIPTSNTEDVIAWLKNGKCATCGGNAAVSKHELRRRAPRLFWRVHFRCGVGHATTRVFDASWLKAAG
jgi:hypothetical protein